MGFLLFKELKLICAAAEPIADIADRRPLSPLVEHTCPPLTAIAGAHIKCIVPFDKRPLDVHGCLVLKFGVKIDKILV